MAYTNSPLVKYTGFSPNHSGQRTHSIDRITPHCVVGQLTAEGICACFPKGREASCNYAIGKDGKIALCVEEKNRSWCSSSPENDQRAITIECASDSTAPYAFNTSVYNALIELCVDICKRNGKNKLLWFGDKTKTLNYSPKSGEMVLTVHRWFAAKSCPGDWMYSRMGNLAKAVTERLSGVSGGNSNNSSTASKPSSTGLSAGTKLTLKNTPLYVSSTAKNKASSKTGTYYVWNSTVVSGRIRITNKTSNVGVSGRVTGWIDVEDAQSAAGGNTSFKPYLVKVTTDVLNIRKGAGTNYATNGAIRDKGTYTIVAEASGQGASKWGKLKSGAGWISLDYVKKV